MLNVRLKIFERIVLLYISGVPCITDCIVGELEKLGAHFSVALKYVMQ